ncbi:MAG: DUF1501 domain-containing protein [Acidobacteriota bacterium]
MAYTRRDFLKGSITALSLTLAAPRFMIGSRALAQSANNRILVVLQLDGGNDGLNTIVPYTDKTYYSLRPTLAIPENSVLKVTDKLGFHPVMTKFKALFDQGHIAVVQNTGYPSPDLSHFRSRAIYQRADPTTQEEQVQLGWLGKYADLKLAQNGSTLAVVNIGGTLPKSLISEKVIAPSINNFELYRFQTDAKYPTDRNNQLNTLRKDYGVKTDSLDYLYIEQTGLDALDSSESLQASLQKYTPEITYANDGLSRQLQMAAQVIAADLGTQIIHLTFGGFDTHAGQKADHEELLTALSDGLDAFYRDLVRLNKADNVLLLAFSEFGRRPKENGSLGTDHGAPGPMFVLGNKVKGGFYGNTLNLEDLDRAGNAKFDIDFRAVYGTVLSDWLATDAASVLGQQFENIGFITQ